MVYQADGTRFSNPCRIFAIFAAEINHARLAVPTPE